MKRVRCAIYTRKSSEEGLEQDFNSLHAQREACEAYILSQASEGWTPVPTAYDDGGLSGGTLERPGLQALLADIAAGRIDIVVVYKVDRLTRSLLDFAKLVEAFDTAGASFVSVTQAFNTTTSMGRLTLNMLLSFAQFEREVTAERIRDKLAASKRKGMWMGGVPPLGYCPDGRTLAIVDEHAALIRDIFDHYVKMGTVRKVAEYLSGAGIQVPVRTMAGTGRSFGGGAFTRGQLYKILSNPVYVGEIVHHAERWPGLHPAIIDRPLWDRVQALLAANGNEHRGRVHARAPSLLAGLIHDGRGDALVATHATKQGRRYRYYVSRSLHHASDAAAGGGIRIPASEIELVVTTRIAQVMADPLGLMERLGHALEPDICSGLVRTGAQLAGQLRNKAEPELVQTFVERIDIGVDDVRITLRTHGLTTALGLEPTSRTADKLPGNLTETIPARLKRSGRAMRLLLPGNVAANAGEPDRVLINAIVRARDWWETLCRTPGMTIEALAKQQGVTASYITRIVRLAFLAPDIIDRIAAGTLPARVDVKSLTLTPLPVCWNAQRTLLGC